MKALLALVPPWVPLAAVGLLLLALGGAVWGWLDAREDLGAAKLSAQVNAASVKTMADQVERNVEIAAQLERLTAPRAETIRETIREIHLQPSSDACRNSAPMRALDGRLRHGGNGQGGGAAPAGSPPAAVQAPRR